MKTRIESLAAIVSAALFSLSIPALGQSVTIDFTGVANPSVQTLGAYAGYYTGTVNGVAATPGFICDDYNDEIYAPETWQASATTFSALAPSGVVNQTALSSTLFGSSIGVDGYAAVAYLSNLMATTPASGQGDIAAAIWYIGALGSGKNGVPSSLETGAITTDSIAWSNLDTTAQDLVLGLLGNSSRYGAVGGSTGHAIIELDSSSISNLWIYTPITGTQTLGDPRPQEFIGDPNLNVPEGGTALLYLLVAAAACCVAILYGRRKRLVTAK